MFIEQCVYIYIKFLQNACDHMLPQCSGPLFLTPRDVGRFGVQNLTTGWSARIMSNHKMKIQRAMHQLEMKFCRSGKSARQKRNHKSKINQQCISSIKNVSPRAKPTGSADNDPLATCVRRDSLGSKQWNRNHHARKATRMIRRCALALAAKCGYPPTPEKTRVGVVGAEINDMDWSILSQNGIRIDQSWQPCGTGVNTPNEIIHNVCKVITFQIRSIEVEQPPMNIKWNHSMNMHQIKQKQSSTGVWKN